MNAFRLSLISIVVSYGISSVHAAELELVRGVAAQPLKAQVKRVVEALSYLGEPLTAEQQTQFDTALKEIAAAHRRITLWPWLVALACLVFMAETVSYTHLTLPTSDLV